MCQILAVLSSPGICSAANVSAVFVFGDSLVEAGNNYYINTIAKPGYPNGIDFAKGSPSGRYTNARTVADIIGKSCNSFVNISRVAPQLISQNLCFSRRGIGF